MSPHDQGGSGKQEGQKRLMNAISDALQRVRDLLSPVIPEDPVDWAESNLDLTNDTTTNADGYIDLYNRAPHIVEPLRCWNDINVSAITVVAPEQTFKSTVWRIGLIWSMVNQPSPSLVVYPNEDDASEENEEKILPLMRGVRELARDLRRPLSYRGDRLHLSKCEIHFQGSGSPIISKSKRIVIGDEVDDWAKSLRSRNLKNLVKRTRTFGEKALCVLVCSPTTVNGPIWSSYRRSSQGLWHLGCIECDAMIDSTNLSCVKYEVDENQDVVNETCFIVCPECGFEHDDDDRQHLNKNGQHVHKYPHRTHKGYNWGILVSQTVSIKHIAEAVEEAKRDFSIVVQQNLTNSFQGKPFSPEVLAVNTEVLQQHIETGGRDSQEVAVFMSVDTQDNGFYWIIRQIYANENSYLLANGFCHSLNDLEDIWDKGINGKKPITMIIDQGGHRSPEIQEFTKTRPGAFSYKGNSRIGTRLKISDTDKKAIIVNPHPFKGQLLYLIYSQTNKERQYWFISDKAFEDSEYVKQIGSYRPPENTRDTGYENWERKGPDHYFDCEKMMLVLIEFAKGRFKDRDWTSKPDWITRLSTRRKPNPNNWR